VLASLAQAYVWSEGEARVSKSLPRNISIPWVRVSEHLGLPPVITHCDVVLNNWTKIDIRGPLELSNLRTIHSFSTAEKDEEWFSLITVQIELEAAPAIRCIVQAQRSVLEDDAESLGECLEIITNSLKQMETVLLRMYERCNPSVFYNEIRPFLAGWKGMKALPQGLIYEGVSETPMQFAGGSAAQSSTIQCFSEGLGIDYLCNSQTVKEAELHANFLTEMREYMPREHREFLAAISRGPSIRDYVKRSKVKSLTLQYNSTLVALEEFRSKHIQVVARYITVESKKGTSLDHDSLKETGTGGTGIMSFLKFIRDQTKLHIL
jgi:indoleamine 2,3-dioxygenase